MVVKSTILRRRTKEFAVAIYLLAGRLPHERRANVIARQITRSALSVGANYREAQMARSPAEFASKAGIALQEAEETTYWLEIIRELRLVPESEINHLLVEAKEISAMLHASIRTARLRKPRNLRRNA